MRGCRPKLPLLTLFAAAVVFAYPVGPGKGPTAEAQRAGLGPVARPEWLMPGVKVSVPRRGATQSGSALIGAAIGAVIGGAWYSYKRTTDNGRHTSALTILPYVAVGAAIGFMAAPIKK
jgi:hypothetical protein